MKNSIAGSTLANRLRLAVFVSLAGIVLAACAASESHERSLWYVSTTGDDSNPCTESYPCRTLGEALTKVDADDQIILAAGTYHETEVEGGYPQIITSLWITGAGMEETIIDLTGVDIGLRVIGWGSYTFEDFTVQNSPTYCLAITAGVRPESEMSGRPGFAVTIENVKASGCGLSGFLGYGDHGTGTGDDVVLTMVDVVATLNGDGGVEAHGAEVTIQGSEFSENQAGLDSIDGAAVSAADSLINANYWGVVVDDDGSLLLEDSTISNSSAEGVYVVGDLAQVQIHNVTINNNLSAITNLGGTIAIRNSWITANTAGAIRNERGEISIDQTTIDENARRLGVIQNDSGAMLIQNSLIANNTGLYAIRNAAELSIRNSTISGNSGTGVFGQGNEISLSYVTIAENGDAGLALQGDSGIDQITNALIVKNGLDCEGTHPVSALRIGGTNFDSDATCPEPFITRSPAEILLASLADNGGTTLTHALLIGSPAIDAASSSCPEGDQRLIPRPFGPACDVGAYEAGAVTPLSLETTATPDTDITVTIIQDARCRIGPDFIYPDYDFFEPGQTTTVHGRSADSNWYYVQALSFSGKCFIGKAVLQFDVEPDVLLALPVIQPPPAPTPTLDPDESYDVTETPEAPKPTACPTLINKPGSCK